MGKFIIYMDAEGITPEEQRRLDEQLMEIGYYTVVNNIENNKRYSLPIYQYYYEGLINDLEIITDQFVELVKKLTNKYEITAHEVLKSKYIGLNEYKA